MAAPVLDTLVTFTLLSVPQGASNPGGTSVANLIPDGSITDLEGDAVEAIAITALDTRLGAWQYSLDGGGSWLTIDTDAINSTTNELALLLGPAAMLRLLPFGDLNGTLDHAITFRAWDQGGGSEGQYVAVEATGGASSFSVDSAVAAVTVIDAATSTSETNRGTLVLDFADGAYDFATSVLVQADGKIVVAGGSQISGVYKSSMARINDDGTFDPSFNSTGQHVAQSATGNWAWGLDQQPDGKLLVTGSSVERFGSEGLLDPSFAGSGHLPASPVDFPHGHAILPDGRFIVAGLGASGTFDFAVARYNADGTLDTSFNGSGSVLTDFGGSSDMAFAVQVLPDGRVLVLGKRDGSGYGSLELARYNTDGSLDTSFDGDGKLVTNISATGFSWGSLALQDDGKIVIGGAGVEKGLADADFRIVRLNADGSADESFGFGGSVVTDLGNGRQDLLGAISIQADGKIVAAGTTDVSGMDWDMALVRYNADGTLDTTLDGAGFVHSDVGNHSEDAAYGLAIQADGKIVLAGSSNAHGTLDYAVARYNNDGSLDTSFGSANLARFEQGGDSVPLKDNIAIYDASLAALNGGAGNYAGATMSLSRNGGPDGADEFTPFGALSFAGPNVVLFGVTVGTVSNTDGVLTITFNANATQARVNGVLSHISYGNSADAPPPMVVIDYGFSTTTTAAVISRVSAAAGPKVVGSVSVHINDTGADTATTGGLAITGTAALGRTLAAVDTIFDGDGFGRLHYQWSADGEPIAGATGSRFVITNSQIGKAIEVAVSFTDFGGAYNVLTSARTALVTGSLALSGTAAADVLIGTDGQDALSGLGGNDSLKGLGGNDTLNGGAGIDFLDGGEGSDLYMVSAPAEHAGAEFHDTGSTGSDEVRFAAGSGTLVLFAADTGIERVVIGTGTDVTPNTSATAAVSVNAAAVKNALWMVGNAGANTLTGTAFADTLDGGAGSDKLTGGAGNDTYAIDNARDAITETATGGIDTVRASVNYALGTNVENLVLAGAATIGTGNTLANSIAGNALANVIDGKAGIDSLDGADGSDVYVIGSATDHSGSEIADTGASGVDEVRFIARSGTLTLFAGDTGIERVVLGTGTAATAVTTGTGALKVDASAVLNMLTMIGNAGANGIVGTAFDDTIDGGKGVDTMSGGLGNDIYGVDNAKDSVVELAGQGTDTVLASATFTLGANVENLTLTGAASIGGTGNAGANMILGNSGANAINGGAGDDTLDGGAGVDRLDGGEGSDNYIIHSAAEHVSAEFADSGVSDVDRVFFASMGADTLTLFAADKGIDLVMFGTISGTSTDNSGVYDLSLDASQAPNALAVLANDGDNTVIGTAFNDFVIGANGDDQLRGNGGDDVLIGGFGMDTLTGGVGADTFWLEFTPGPQNFLAITDFTSGQDKIWLTEPNAVGALNAHAITSEQFYSGAGVVAGHDADDRFIFDTSSGILYYDADGSGSGEAVKIAVIGTLSTVLFSDIEIVN